MSVVLIVEKVALTNGRFRKVLKSRSMRPTSVPRFASIGSISDGP